MEKSGLFTSELAQDEILRLENITLLTLKNYGNTEMTVIHNGVAEKIPVFDVVNNYAESFEIPADNTFTEKVELNVKFTGGKGSAILRYKYLKNC